MRRPEIKRIMKDVKSFLKIKRKETPYRPVNERIADYKEVFLSRSDDDSQEQACRCMDCGTPFCHWACPLGNYIPEWNSLVNAGRWEEALLLLEAENNLPEITGRVCPALCEYSCVLGINDDAVTIRENELAIIEYAFSKGFIKPKLQGRRNSATGKKVAVIGSGPAGLSVAAQLNRAGHYVTVYEKDNKPGGILRYGIPDFKLEKPVLDRRIDIWKKEGVVFKTGINVGEDYPVSKLLKEFDAVCLSIGSRAPRDLKIQGRELSGIYFAMDFLIQANKKVSREKVKNNELIDVKNKKVVVIGGGDTGADCVGVCHRQGAFGVVQLEVMPIPPEHRTQDCPWPKYPLLLKNSSSHQEGGRRLWSILTKRFIGGEGNIKKIVCVKVDVSFNEIPGSEFEIEADVVLLAIGFLHPEQKGIISDLGLKLDNRGNIKGNEQYMTSINGVFSAGDVRTGQSLVVWAIQEGRKAAHYIDQYLMGKSELPNL